VSTPLTRKAGSLRLAVVVAGGARQSFKAGEARLAVVCYFYHHFGSEK
jgi:hypothetical protein